MDNKTKETLVRAGIFLQSLAHVHDIDPDDTAIRVRAVRGSGLREVLHESEEVTLSSVLADIASLTGFGDMEVKEAE